MIVKDELKDMVSELQFVIHNNLESIIKKRIESSDVEVLIDGIKVDSCNIRYIKADKYDTGVIVLDIEREVEKDNKIGKYIRLDRELKEYLHSKGFVIEKKEMANAA